MTEKIPIIERKKAYKLGGSICLPLPLEWFRAHGFGNTPEEIKKNLGDMEFLILGDMDLRIVNPKHRKKVEEELYKPISERVNTPITEQINEE